jgi:hypothetical protein
VKIPKGQPRPNNGGRRPGAGRPKGSKNRTTVKKLKIVEKLVEEKKTPLEFLIGVMLDKGKDIELRVDAAKAAAPYVHPKLAQTELNLNANLRTMTDEDVTRELAELLEDPAIAALAGRKARSK